MSQHVVAYDDFVAQFPEFATLPQSAVERTLLFAADFFNEPAWGRMYTHACVLLAAHRLFLRFNVSDALHQNALRSPSSTIGITTSKSATTSGLSEGSVVNGLVTSDNPILADLARTGYGLELLDLIYSWMPACEAVLSPDTSATYWRYDA